MTALLQSISVDGNELVDKLKDLGLGVGKEMIEVVTVDAAWFENV